MSDVLDKALWLVEQASPTGQEGPLCESLLSWAERRLGLQPTCRYRQGFRVEREKSPELPWVALVGHIDTVPEAVPQRLGLQGGRLYGCGASDMKAGVALMMQALEQADLWGVNLVGLFYDQEEGPYALNGLEPLLEEMRPVHYAVVLEPTNNEIQAGCVGSLQARLKVPGQRAHSARPWQGKNAIYAALPLLEKLALSQPKSVLSGGLEFFEVVTATQASTQGPTNAVPDRFVLNLNSRFAPGKSCELAVEELRELVGDLGELEIYDIAPAGEVRLDHPRLRRWLSECGLTVTPKQAWTDVARLSQRGIAAFNFGPGDPAQAHQADEYVEIAALEEGYQLLAHLLS